MISRVLFFTVDGGIGDALLGVIAVVDEGGRKEFPCSGGKRTTVYPAKILRVEKSAGEILSIPNFLETIPPATLSMLLYTVAYTVIHNDADKHAALTS